MTTQTAELIVADKLGAVARPMDIEGLFRFAMEKGGGVETIERLMTIRRELNAEEAKRAFDSAMAAFQSDCPVVDKPTSVKDNSGTRAYSFASLDHVIATVKPTLEKHGFSHKFDTDVKSEPGWVIAMCIVTHRAGHSETSTAKFPLGAGTRIMSTTQIYAAALTFACRRVFQNAFGIVCAGEDTVEKGLRQKPAGPSSIQPENISLKDLSAELWKALQSVRGSENNWKVANQFLWDENIISDSEQAPAFEAKRFREVINKVKGKLNV